jgi:hypothetical protein
MQGLPLCQLNMFSVLEFHDDESFEYYFVDDSFEDKQVENSFIEKVVTFGTENLVLSHTELTATESNST